MISKLKPSSYRYCGECFYGFRNELIERVDEDMGHMMNDYFICRRFPPIFNDNYCHRFCSKRKGEQDIDDTQRDSDADYCRGCCLCWEYPVVHMGCGEFKERDINDPNKVKLVDE